MRTDRYILASIILLVISTLIAIFFLKDLTVWQSALLGMMTWIPGIVFEIKRWFIMRRYGWGHVYHYDPNGKN